jgi:hypothetical protein
MNYAKPEVVVLGEATRMIDFLRVKQFRLLLDFFLLGINPAYELDE